MAEVVGKDASSEEYESDPEEAKLSLKLRREASDDEESEKTEKPPGIINSDDDDDESEDGQLGAAAEYDDEEDDDGTEFSGDEEVYEVVEAEAIVEEEDDVVKDVLKELCSGMDDYVVVEKEEVIEPYAVPKAGAFYMHEDRSRGYERGRGRNRRTFGGRKLWESKDDSRWGHDKFEELMEESYYEEVRRTSRGRFRGRGRPRGAERGTSWVRRTKAHMNDYNQTIQNNDSKTVRGRGPIRYRPLSKESFDAPPLNTQSGQFVEKVSHNSTGKASLPVSNLKKDGTTSAKQGVLSSLNYASPPFYPSNSSAKEITVTHKRELQTRSGSHHVQSSSAATQSTAMLPGKAVSDSLSINKLKVDDSLSRKLQSILQLPPGSSSVNFIQSNPLRGQGRGFNTLPPMNYSHPVPVNQGHGVSPPTQRNSFQSRGQPSLQVTQQQSGTGSQSSSPPKTGKTLNTLHGELQSSLESGKLKSSMVAKGNLRGTGRGSLLYGGAQVMGAPGNMGSCQSDQNLSGTPTYFPVMHFGGQQPGGTGVTAVGMAFPGYVAQPQFGLGNSDMTWLPVLAGAAGALGATYSSPYFAFDGAYHTRPAGGQISSLTAAPSKEDTSKPNHGRKPQQSNELTNDYSGRRQKNPRRYTEMKFDQ